jgi:tRNA (guanine-N7-)-methyltransferase
MRMRKKPWVDTLLENPPSFVHKDCKVINDLSLKHFKSVHLEIGSGKGDYWILMSQANPTDFWIGIEKDVKVAAVAIKKALDVIQDNQVFVVADAQKCLEDIQDGFVDIIHLNFSDPWPKKRTHKRRLSASTFIQQYQRILSRDGQIIMKTDNKDLFEYSMVSFSQADFVLEEMSVDFRRTPHDDAISEYEARFMSLNQPIYRCVWRKKSHG